MPTGTRVDPYKNYRFLVEIEGLTLGGFTECSGFGSEVEAIEYREGGDAATVHKIPGKVTYPDITLKWGLTDSRDLYEWHREFISGKGKRKSGSIILHDDQAQEVTRWNFFDAWPSTWDGPDFNSTGSEVAIDSMTLKCERVERAK